MEVKTFEEWKNHVDGLRPLGVIIFKATPLEEWAWKTVPYCPWLPISKRTRVKIRRYFRYGWSRRANKALVDSLKGSIVSNSRPFDYQISEDDYTWDIVVKHKEE